MNDINSLPNVPAHMIEAMQREAERKFGKVPGLEESPAPAQMNPILQHHEEPQSIDSPENMESQSENSGNEPEMVANQAQESQNTSEQAPLSDRENNLRIMRERAKQAERERDEAMRRLKEIAERQQAAQPHVEQQPLTQTQKLAINPDDLVEGRHINELYQKIDHLESQLQRNQQQTYQTSIDARLKAQYPDLEKVLTADNIETFKMAYPELASTVASTTDYYNKAVAAYTMIKKFGIHQEESNTLEKQVIQKNIAKPRPLASVSPQQGDSPISRANAFANGLTNDLKEQLRKEMNQARQGY